MKTVKTAILLIEAAGWTAAFWALCLVSEDIRKIRDGLAAAGRDIDPLVRIGRQTDDIWYGGR